VAYLRQCFPNLVIPFKQHCVVELSRPLDTFVHQHHRRYARKALREVCVERCDDPANFLDDWTALYSVLIDKHRITGIAAFSKEAFAKQLTVPGLVIFRATHEGEVVGMTLWYVQKNVAYYHLGAYSPAGYDLRASFALFWRSLESFATQGLQWLNLGAGAGLGGEGTDGLSRFKRGWATGTRTAYLCGRIFDPVKYQELVKAKAVKPDDYFPAYRGGEFV
jgi:hypothetical protein